MTPATPWSAIAPAVADHLWQSTLFAVAAGLLTLVLQKNQARARYTLWLIASLKFLAPFFWLVAIASRLSWHGAAATPSGQYYLVEQISQPFTRASAPALLHPPVGSPSLTHALPAIVLALWLGGFLMVLLTWIWRSRKVSIAISASVPLHEGREIEALRRQERITGIGQHIELLISRSTLEPGIFGMARPVLVWPEGISAHLDDPHLESILAHELWHVRRRDNLGAALHMMVEAIFWFHPLVWWMGARLVEERERACDEAVVELGCERRIYAESILKVCEFCVGSPLALVSGVTGADLKKRMVHIMSEQVARQLDLGKKLLLAVAGVLALAAPIVVGAAQATPARAPSPTDDPTSASAWFDKVSITPSAETAPTPGYAGTHAHMVRMMYGPDGFVAKNVTLRTLIEEAYGVHSNQLVGGPDWLSSATFDVSAQPGSADAVQPGLPPDPGRAQKLLRTVLADRARLALHTETRELPGYALVVARGGAKLPPSQPADREPVAPPAPGAQLFMQSVRTGPNGQPGETHSMRMQIDNGEVVGMAAQGVSIHDFASQLSRQLGVAVVDQTGLEGNYNFSLQWRRGSDPSPSVKGDPSADDSESSGSLMAAIQEQLGLKLEPQKAPTPVLIIDHIEKPDDN